jgi:hypothetical protein
VTVAAVPLPDGEGVASGLRQAELEEVLAVSRKVGTESSLSSALVAVARDPRNPLHRRFEWDDTIASEKYRLGQAEDLIRQVNVTREDTTPTVRLFVAQRVVDDDPTSVARGTYTTIAAIKGDERAQELVLRQMRRDLEAFKARYSANKSLFGDMFREVFGDDLF